MTSVALLVKDVMLAANGEAAAVCAAYMPRTPPPLPIPPAMCVHVYTQVPRQRRHPGAFQGDPCGQGAGTHPYGGQRQRAQPIWGQALCTQHAGV